jgi:hypothetical protein
MKHESTNLMVDPLDLRKKKMIEKWLGVLRELVKASLAKVDFREYQK